MTDAVKIRFPILVNAAGKSAAYGWNGAGDDAEGVLYDMMGDEDIDTARRFFVTVEVPLPQPMESRINRTVNLTEKRT